MRALTLIIYLLEALLISTEPKPKAINSPFPVCGVRSAKYIQALDKEVLISVQQLRGSGKVCL